MHHPLFPPLPLFALREKDVYVYICMRVKARIRLKRTRKKISSPSSHRERLFSLDDSWNTFTHVHYEPLSLSQNQRISYSKSFSNLCAAQYLRHSFPQNRCLLLAELGLGVCSPSLSFKRFFCLPLPSSSPRWTLLFRPFDEIN